MARGVRMSGTWAADVQAAVGQWLDRTLGQQIEDDARQFCPVDTGDLRDSIEHHMDGDVLVVRATGSDERFYAVYLEMGHRVYHPSTRMVGPELVPASPFLRPALWQARRP